MATTYIVDGHKYSSESSIPDLGSLVGIQNADGTRSYSGKNADALKLPVYDDLMAGSDASLIGDDGIHVYMFNGTEWKGYNQWG